MKFNHTAETFLQIDTAKIYYEEIGDPKSQPLILLHGGFGNMEDFNSLLPLFNKEYRFIGVDCRGQGKSTLGDEELTYALIEKDIQKLNEKLNLKNALVIGFSDGGIAALRLACAKHIEISKLIIIGSSWHSKSLDDSKIYLEKITAEKWKTRFPTTYEAYQKLNPEPDFEKLTDSIVKMWIDEKHTGHPNENVKNINRPTLIIHGDDDPLISTQSCIELSEMIKTSHFSNIAFAGHEVYKDQEQILMETINQFLNK